MIIAIVTFLALSSFFGAEFLLKVRWLKPFFSLVVTISISIAVFRFALSAGEKVERYNNAGIVEDSLDLFEESTRSNSLPEIQVKLSIVRQELPKAIRSGEPNTPKLLE